MCPEFRAASKVVSLCDINKAHLNWEKIYSSQESAGILAKILADEHKSGFGEGKKEM